MVTLIEPRTIKADEALTVAGKILNAEIETSEVYAFQLRGDVSELYNIIDSLEYIKPVKCPDGQYQIVENKDGSLSLQSSTHGKFELCFDSRRVIKRYLIDLEVRILNSKGLRGQIENTEFMYETVSDLLKWYTKQTYHFMPIIMYNITGDIIKYYSEYVSDEYVKSYISSLNSKYENKLIENDETTRDGFESSVDYTNIKDICRVAYFDGEDGEQKLESVMNQMKEMFKGLNSYQVGEIVDKGVLENIKEFKELKGLPEELMPTVCLKDILMKTYNNIRLEVDN